MVSFPEVIKGELNHNLLIHSSLPNKQSYFFDILECLLLSFSSLCATLNRKLSESPTIDLFIQSLLSKLFKENWTSYSQSIL